ncbi:MAG TPA: hypothetical protein VL307_18020 [Chitinophagaceae bacterium]|nr:hypothetical protein [Chitinophagaceae bacterium]
MPCTPAMIERAIECASEYSLNSFTASPANITPGQPVTLTWSTAHSGHCAASFRINGITVPASGSKTVNPLADTTYTLTLQTQCNISRTLGRASVDVNESTCKLTSIPESLVRGQVISVVDSSINEFNASSSNDLSKRSETQVEIDPQGISIKLRLKAAINNFPDPDLNVDMKVGLGVGPGNTVSVFYRAFSVDVDWPWWVTGISLGITKIVEEIAEGRIQGKIKPQILEALKTQLNNAAKQIPGVLTSIETLQDELRLKIC